jgi:hypothetical protein
MFSLLSSDQLLSSPNWLSAAPDPRPDQLPHPVRAPESLSIVFVLSLSYASLHLHEFYIVPYIGSIYEFI